MLVFNTTDAQLELTKEAVASVLDQDIPTVLWIVNNGSTAPTGVWLDGLLEQHPERVVVWTLPVNTSPVHVTNNMFRFIFGKSECDYILGVPNDVVLPRHFYRELLKWPRGIVTASQTQDKEAVHFDKGERTVAAVSECTPMAVALIRSWVHSALVEKDGYFLDPRFNFYCSDCDLALRIAACGIRGVQLNLSYYHFCSASHRLADPVIGKRITDQAYIDRASFERKWSFSVDAPEYGQACGDINFRGVGQ